MRGSIVARRVLRVLRAGGALGHLGSLVSLLDLDMLSGLILLAFVVFEKVHPANTSIGHRQPLAPGPVHLPVAIQRAGRLDLDTVQLVGIAELVDSFLCVWRDRLGW